MIGIFLKKRGEMWQYSKTAEVLKVAGRHTIAHYVGVRRQSIAQWIVKRPIFKMCRGEVRRCGTTPRQFAGDSQWI